MRLNRFFVAKIHERDGGISVPDPDVARQISRVLRLPTGSTVELFDGSGRVVTATLAEATRDGARFEKVTDEHRDDASRVARRVDLYPSAIKGDHLSMVVEKGSELGVARVQPVVARRSVKRDANVSRLARVAREAAEQCGRSSVAEVAEPLSLVDAIDAARASGATLVALDQDADEKFSDVVAGLPHVAIFVGPEGGWDARDLAAFDAAHVARAALGGFVLRAETASIVAAAIAARE